MGIPVKLPVFEGPLELLLHLIEKNKIDIYDIPIVEITNQYMEYIRQMEREDLNIMKRVPCDGGNAPGHQVPDAPSERGQRGRRGGRSEAGACRAVVAVQDVQIYIL